MQKAQEMRVWSLGGEDPLEEEMATHCTLTWKIPRTEEPGGLQSLGLQKSQIWLSTHTHTHTWSILSLFWKSVVRSVSRSVFLHVDVHLLKKLYYSGSFVKNQMTIFTEFYSWALYSVPLIYLSVLLTLSHCPDCCSSIVSLEVVECQSSNFVLLLQHFFGYSGSCAFTFPYKL